jgi:hypothetical protein
MSRSRTTPPPSGYISSTYPITLFIHNPAL